MRAVLISLCLFVLVACGAPPRDIDTEAVARLEQAILALDPSVSAEDAAQAAALSYAATAELALAYEITDPPLVHNTKVNMGIKPRGLCWHWAEDLQKRLNAAGFDTLVVHRAIANADNPFRIDHSTAILSAKGDDMFAGLVLDPWRYGGRLFWGPVSEDTRYKWVPQAEAHEIIRARQERRAN